MKFPTIAKPDWKDWVEANAPLVTGQLRERVIKDMARDLAEGKTVHVVLSGVLVTAKVIGGTVTVKKAANV